MEQINNSAYSLKKNQLEISGADSQHTMASGFSHWISDCWSLRRRNCKRPVQHSMRKHVCKLIFVSISLLIKRLHVSVLVGFYINIPWWREMGEIWVLVSEKISIHFYVHVVEMKLNMVKYFCLVLLIWGKIDLIISYYLYQSPKIPSPNALKFVTWTANVTCGRSTFVWNSILAVMQQLWLRAKKRKSYSWDN